MCALYIVAMAMKPMHKLLVAAAVASIVCLVFMMVTKKKKMQDLPPLPPMYSLPPVTYAPRVDLSAMPASPSGPPAIAAARPTILPTGPPEVMGYLDPEDDDWGPVP